MSNFLDAFDYVMQFEGQEVNILPNDSGGITKFGISLSFLKEIPLGRLNKYGIYPKNSEVNSETIKELNLDQAKEVFKGEFWNMAPFNLVRSQKVTNYIFDMAINMGLQEAITCTQHALWAAASQRNYAKIDGILGDDTITKINRFVIFLLPPLRAERAAYYRILVLKDERKKSNLNSWLNRTYKEQ